MEYQCGKHLVTVDDECGAIYIYVGGRREAKELFTVSLDTEGTTGMVNGDFDEDNRLFGVEIIT